MRYDERQSAPRSWLKDATLMLTGGLVIALLLLGVKTWQSGDRVLSMLTNLIANPQPKPEADVQSVVIQQIRNASQLTTAVFTMQAVVPTRQEASLHGFVIGTTKLLYIAHGEVQAGVDLSQLQPENVQIVGETVRIQLPPPQILNSKIDVNRSRVYDYDRGLFNLGPDTAPELQTLAQQEALKKVVAAACESGVLQQASDRASLVVSQLFNTAGYKNVTVERQAIAPNSCGTAATTGEVQDPPGESGNNSI